MDRTLIELRPDRPGFNSFFGSWLVTGENTLLIDVGPAATSEQLIRATDSLGVDQVDYVLLTHIHIDHAGGLADVLESYPASRVICHERAVDHLADPSRLWKGSFEVLGDVAETYGRPRPVPQERLIPHTQNPVEGLRVIETPGHAVHHLSFVYGGCLFAGEAAGNYLLVGQEEYVRPATPPRFLMNVCLESVDRLLALEDEPVCFAHFGEADQSRRLLRSFREQLMRWERIIRGEMNQGEGELIPRCIDQLLKHDPNLAPFGRLDPAGQQREEFFMTNSIRGFVGYLKDQAG